jgi:hypothetical protein
VNVRFYSSLPIWGAWIAMFLLFELTPVFWSGCPWFTLSETVWGVQHWWHLFRLVVAVFLLILALHFAWHVPAGWLIACVLGAGIALCLHLFVPHFL